MDVEVLRMMQAEFTPLEINEEALAFGAHEEAGHGGHFLGTMHTMERFRDCFYRPFLSSADNFDRWTRNGEKTTDIRANEIAKKMISEYEAPAMDDAIKAELDEFVARRKKELEG
jgi:trimethylamine--corrinoid protein Co-methyltransferase